jgi:hypothetical protein
VTNGEVPVLVIAVGMPSILLGGHHVVDQRIRKETGRKWIRDRCHRAQIWICQQDARVWRVDLQNVHLVKVLRHDEDAVATTDHPCITQAIGKSETRRQRVGRFNEQIDLLTWFRPQDRLPTGIEVEPQRPAGAVSVARQQVPVITQAQVERESRRDAPVILEVESMPPLPHS